MLIQKNEHKGLLLLIFLFFIFVIYIYIERLINCNISRNILLHILFLFKKLKINCAHYYANKIEKERRKTRPKNDVYLMYNSVNCSDFD